MVIIKNTQRREIFDKMRFAQDAERLLSFLGYEQYDLFVWVTTNQTIRYYNKTYRHKDKSTDILSFPFYPEIKPGQKIVPASPDEMNLGDIIISAQRTAFDAKELGVSLYQRLRVLLVHGVCHLLGYDHQTDCDYEQMHREEERLLSYLEELDLSDSQSL